MANPQNVKKEVLTPEEKKRAGFKLGLQVAGGLALLTLLETGFAGGAAPFLFLIALAKAGLVVQFFMHVSNLWSPEAH
jgi:hypothetical protein